MYEIRNYISPDGRDLFREWYRKLRDTKARIAIDRRIYRIESGNFGDHKWEGVWELRIDIGAGYRLYYAISGAAVVILLCGGDKTTQTVDIDRACEYWKREKGALSDAKQNS